MDNTVLDSRETPNSDRCSNHPVINPTHALWSVRERPNGSIATWPRL